LLLSGEYAVLDGAKAIGLPTRLGQSMTVKKSSNADLLWESFDNEGKVWFKSAISLFDFSAVETTDEKVSAYLQKLLKNSVRLNSEFLSQWNGFKIETRLEFPLDWGLGSSSTLVYLLAEWAEVNPLLLYFKTDDGSGYDVACTFADGPIEYINSPDEVSYTSIDFNPKFRDQLYFVHLGRKQDSTLGIKEYLKAVKNKSAFVKSISSISEEIKNVATLSDFDTLIQQHEDIVHRHTGFTKVKDSLFTDYWGSVKSLGAWGGDFVLATSEHDSAATKDYFSKKGFDTILSFKELIFQ
jgi:mevalonate kinase